MVDQALREGLNRCEEMKETAITKFGCKCQVHNTRTNLKEDSWSTLDLGDNRGF